MIMIKFFSILITAVFFMLGVIAVVMGFCTLTAHNSIIGVFMVSIGYVNRKVDAEITI